MPENRHDRYRIPSARWATWDYGSNAPYFVTICTKQLIPHFGSIKNRTIHYTQLGNHAVQCWQAIPDHFPFAILDAFVVMPNHVHGIIVINKPQNEQKEWQTNQFGPQSQNLASIVRGYKVAVTIASRSFAPLFEWQPRYHDHVIRNEKSLHRIRHYINTNIENWEADRFY